MDGKDVCEHSMGGSLCMGLLKIYFILYWRNMKRVWTVQGGWGDSGTRSHEAKSKLCLLTACETKSVSFVAVSTQLAFGNHRENPE